MVPLAVNLYMVLPLAVVIVGEPVVEVAGVGELIITTPEPPLPPL
jgi:hypothetical protein